MVIFLIVQNSSISSAEEPLIPSIKALVAPALVPINKSKELKILFPDSASNFFKKYTPMIALTPPPSKAKTFLYFFEKRLRYFKFLKK